MIGRIHLWKCFYKTGVSEFPESLLDTILNIIIIWVVTMLQDDATFVILSCNFIPMTSLRCRHYFTILQMWDPNLRETKQLTPSHTVHKEISQNLNLGLFVEFQSWNSYKLVALKLCSLHQNPLDAWIKCRLLGPMCRDFDSVTSIVGPENLIPTSSQVTQMLLAKELDFENHWLKWLNMLIWLFN